MQLFFVLLMLLPYLVGCDDAVDLRPQEVEMSAIPVAVIYRSSADRIELRWTRTPFAEEYRIYTSEQSDGAFEFVAAARDTVWREAVGVDSFPEMRFYQITSVSDSVESIPSRQVGFVSKNISAPPEPGIRMPNSFCIPLTPWQRNAEGIPIVGTESFAPGDVFGDQLFPYDGFVGDLIIDQSDTTRQAWLDPSAVWNGSLAETGMSATWPCWLGRHTPISTTILLCGRVENGASESVFVEGSPADGVTRATPLCFKDARVVSVDRLGLLEAGFIGGGVASSDKLVDQGFLFEARFSPAYGWAGSMAFVSPGHAYWLDRKHVGGFDYTYIPQ